MRGIVTRLLLNSARVVEKANSQLFLGCPYSRPLHAWGSPPPNLPESTLCDRAEILTSGSQLLPCSWLVPAFLLPHFLVLLAAPLQHGSNR